MASKLSPAAGNVKARRRQVEFAPRRQRVGGSSPFGLDQRQQRNLVARGDIVERFIVADAVRARRVRGIERMHVLGAERIRGKRRVFRAAAQPGCGARALGAL